MHTEKREDPLVELGYEVRDINIKAIKNATIIFFAFALGSGALGGGIYALMNPRVLQGQPTATFDRRMPAKGNPLLQSDMTAKTDTMVLRRMESESLFGAPSQQKDGSYRIPVEVAMKMVAEEGGKTPGVREATVQQTSRPQGTPAQRPELGTTTPTVQPDVNIVISSPKEAGLAPHRP